MSMYETWSKLLGRNYRYNFAETMLHHYRKARDPQVRSSPVLTVLNVLIYVFVFNALI